MRLDSFPERVRFTNPRPNASIAGLLNCFSLSLVGLASAAASNSAYATEEYAFWNKSHFNCIGFSEQPGFNAPTVDQVIATTIKKCGEAHAANPQMYGYIRSMVPTGPAQISDRGDWPYFVPVEIEHWSGSQFYTYSDRIYGRIEIIRDETSVPDNCASSAYVGNPMNVLTGEKHQKIDLGARLHGFALSLVYKSRGVNVVRPLGDMAGWELSLNRQLYIERDWTNPTAQVTAARGGGQYVVFKYVNGSFQGPVGIRDSLAFDGSNWRYTSIEEGQYEEYDATGRVQRIVRAAGGTLTFTYAAIDGVTRLSQISDELGKQVVFAYSGGNLASLTNEHGAKFADFTVSDRRLTKITWPDAKSQQFLYENALFPFNLTGLIDEAEVLTSKYVYNDKGVLLSTERAGGVDKFARVGSFLPWITTETIYDPVRKVNQTRRYWNSYSFKLQSPNGQTSDYTPVMFNGRMLVNSKSQPAGSGCSASTSYQSYDANGNITSTEDFSRAKVCRSYDLSRNLETERVEGLTSSSTCGAAMPVGARKIKTAWHPDWALESAVSEPRRLTTNIYNGQPDPFAGNQIASCAPSSAVLPNGKPIVVLCKTVVQDTTDTDGSQGFSAPIATGTPTLTSQFTYNEQGQLLSFIDPAGSTTTYTYYSDADGTHSFGDLQSIRNGRGHVTTITRYNAYGQAVQSQDPNGVVTDLSYDERQRLTGISVGGSSTVYSYWPTGLLRTVTLPDQSALSYEYDGAHRLTAIVHSSGGRIEYTLDAAGNRVSQAVKDSTGQLTNKVDRVMDAIGRVQQLTGRE